MQWDVGTLVCAATCLLPWLLTPPPLGDSAHLEVKEHPPYSSYVSGPFKELNAWRVLEREYEYGCSLHLHHRPWTDALTRYPSHLANQ